MDSKTVRIAAAVVAAAVVAGCSKQGGEEKVDLSESARTAAKSAGVEASGKEGKSLHIYTWSDYISPDVKSGFEKALGVKVVIDTFDSNEAMYAKLKAGGTGYDIITPSSYFVPLMIRENLIRKLDHSKLPNVKPNFDKSFADQVLDPTFAYNVPYAVTYTGFMYLKKKIPADVDVNTWKVLDNPAFKGKVTLLDDIREVIGAGLMSLGYSLNSSNAAEIDAAVEQVLKWRQNVRKFDAESYKTEVASGATWIGHGYSTDATQVILGDEDEGTPARSDIGFALPKEGFTIAVDEMVIPVSAPEPDLAYAFINYVYTADVAKANMEYIMGPMPVRPGIDALDADYRNDIVLSPNVLKRGQVLRSIDDDPEVKAMYDKAWDRIKATSAR